jgi:hypothetical protein
MRYPPSRGMYDPALGRHEIAVEQVDGAVDISEEKTG